MAETFRKAKIEKYFTSLRIRKSVAKSQLENGGTLTVDKKFDDMMTARQKGYIEALDLIIKELENEFDLYNPDNPDSDVNKLSEN
jgi:hypothetical protein